MTWLGPEEVHNKTDSYRQMANDEMALKSMMMRLLEIARDEKEWSIEKDTEREWMSYLVIGDRFSLPLYGGEADLVHTILTCDCKSPGQCGRVIVRMCGLVLREPEPS